MAEQISYDLFEKGLTAKQVILTVGYDRESLMQTDYKGEIKTDHYGRLSECNRFVKNYI